MLCINRKSGEAISGLTYKADENSFRGRIYTAMPLRLRAAIRKSAIWSIASVLLFRLSGESAYNVVDVFLINFFPAWALFYIAFAIFDFGKPIRMTSDHLHIGFSRYNLNDVQSFNIAEVNDKTSDYFIVFEYGNREVVVRVRNDHDTQFRIVEALNYIKDTIVDISARREEAPLARIEVRSSSF